MKKLNIHQRFTITAAIAGAIAGAGIVTLIFIGAHRSQLPEETPQAGDLLVMQADGTAGYYLMQGKQAQRYPNWREADRSEGIRNRYTVPWAEIAAGEPQTVYVLNMSEEEAGDTLVVEFRRNDTAWLGNAE